MPWYRNSTRHRSILTVRILSIQGLEQNVMCGLPSALKALPVKVGEYYDVAVGASEVIEVPDGMSVELFAVRNAP